MTQFRLSTPVWKWLACSLALFSAVLLVIEFTHAVKPLLVDGTQGSLGVVLDDQIGSTHRGMGTYRLRIAALKPDSPLGAAGAQPGDYLQFHRYLDRFRKFAPGERVGLTLYQGAGMRNLSVVAIAEPIGFADYFDYCARFMLALPAILFGLMIAFKQGEGRSSRALAMAFILLSLVYFFNFNYSPASPAFALSKFGNITILLLTWYCCVVFALSYQPYGKSALRNSLMRLFPWYRLLAFATALYSIGYALGMETPLLWIGLLLTRVGCIVLVIGSLVDGWRHSSGELRQRHLWLLLSFGLGTLPTFLTMIPVLDAAVAGVRITVMMYFVGQLLMFAGLAYAVLKYRVFNFDFAISRALVFSVVSVLLLSMFGLIEWIYASMMHGGGHGAEKNSLVVDAALALLAYLVLHKVHGRLERGVEHFLFGKWHVNEHKLRAYVRSAAQITTAESLLDSFRSALDRFTGQAGCAIYVRQDSGAYALTAGKLEGAPGSVDCNDHAAVAMRTDLKPMFIEQMPTVLRGDLLLPMSHRGVLDGFVLVGSKPRGQSYRPDEFEVLGFAAHQVGLDLHALRVEILEREVCELERKADLHSEELILMAGRRRGARGVAEPAGTGVGAISV